MATVSNNGEYPISGILAEIEKYRYNPSAIQQVSLQHLRDITSGVVNIVDPTNPFVFSLESSAVNTAAFMIQNEANTRKQYPAAAQTPEDVYIHMSDVDYIDRFATPVSTVFSIMILLDDLKSKMVLEPETNAKKITFPRNTEFIVADVTFSLQYPIDIREMEHGDIQVSYDADIVSPLQTLSTNIIKREIRTGPSGVEWLYFEFDVTQFKINSVTTPLTSSTSFTTDLELTDNFYYCRIYTQDNSNLNSWKEIYTTHTDQVYDITKPTAVLKVVDKVLNVTIPQIYLNTDVLKGTLRIDVYETLGELNMVMDNYPASSFSTKLRSIDQYRDVTPYTAVTPSITYVAYSTKIVSGGTAALSFEKLRERVIKNSIGAHSLPVTNVQIESALDKKGYQIVKNVDLVTNRIYLATKSLPDPFDVRLITAGSASVETLIVSMREAATYGAKDNGERITLTPDIIYKNDSGIIRIYPKSQVNALINSVDKDDIVTAITNNNFLYTPFYYVLDSSSSEFELRPYYLDNPVAESIRFISQNETTGYQVNSQFYTLSKKEDGTGFKLTIVTSSNQAYKEIPDANIFLQLSYIPKGEVERAYINGSLRMGINQYGVIESVKTDNGERIFDFNLGTEFDIDNADYLILDTFKMFTDDVKLTGTPLSNTFDLYYSTNIGVPDTWVPDSSDASLGKFILPLDVAGITHESINLKFGDSLKTLWARSRSVMQTAPYLKYEADVPWLYEKDVYEIDPVTGSTFSIDGLGNITYNILHHQGDPILDVNGNPTIRYHAGDIRLDANDMPIPTDDTLVVRQLDMMFIEGAYYFATDTSSAKYRTEMVRTIVDWLTIDLTAMSKTLLEQTKIYFYPKKSMGSIRVMVNDGQITNIEAGQYFNVKLYVSTQVYKNNELRYALTNSTIKTIDNKLKSSRISMSEIVSELRKAYGSDVISVSITGLGGTKNLDALTIMNEGDRCSIRKRLLKLPDNTLIVNEDVTVEFIKHQI